MTSRFAGFTGGLKVGDQLPGASDLALARDTVARLQATHVLCVGERTLGSRWTGPVQVRARLVDFKGGQLGEWIQSCVLPRFPPGVPADVTIVLVG